jgi:hypothetical protein
VPIILPSVAGAAAAAAGAAAASANGWRTEQLCSEHVPWQHQTDAVADMVRKHKAGRRGHYLHSPTGSGKTLIVCMYLLYLATERDQLPPYVVYTLPKEAIMSIATELLSYGFRVCLLVTEAQRVVEEKKRTQARQAQRRIKAGEEDVAPVACLSAAVHLQTDWSTLSPFTISLVEHDTMRKIGDVLRASCGDLLVVVDEAHKTLNDTQRTTIVLEVASQARGGFVALSASPINDSKVYKLVPWLSLVCPFTVNIVNFWAACTSLVSQQLDSPIHVNVHDLEVPWTSSEAEQAYLRLVPAKLGGSNSHATGDDIKQALTMCYAVTTREMARLAYEVLYDKLHFGDAAAWRGGVFMVTDNAKHQQEVKQMLLTDGGGGGGGGNHPTLRERDIFCIGPDGPLHLSDQAVASGTVRDFAVVITTKRHCSGYTCSRLKASISGVFATALSTRIQLLGRLNRLSQSAKEIDQYTVMIGILTRMHAYHLDASSIDAALKSMGVLIERL